MKNFHKMVTPPPRIVFVKSLFRFLTKLMKEIILLYYYHTSNLFWPKSCHFKFKKALKNGLTPPTMG